MVVGTLEKTLSGSIPIYLFRKRIRAFSGPSYMLKRGEQCKNAIVKPGKRQTLRSPTSSGIPSEMNSLLHQIKFGTLYSDGEANRSLSWHLRGRNLPALATLVY